MPLQVLSRQTHKDLRLVRPDQPWAFARTRMIAGLVAPELAEAGKSFPIAFSRNGDRVNVLCLLGLGDRNLFIDEQGRWIGAYIPAVLRAWPFSLVQQGEQRVIGLDDESDAFSRTEGDPLFDEAGEPSERLQKTVKFLQTFSDQEQVMTRAVTALDKAGLLVPWDLAVKRGDGSGLNISGLLQVDRAAFEALPDDAFLTLRREGALPLVYAHVFSQRNVSQLETLAKRREAAPAAAQATADMPQALYITDDYLKF